VIACNWASRGFRLRPGFLKEIEDLGNPYEMFSDGWLTWWKAVSLNCARKNYIGRKWFFFFYGNGKAIQIHPQYPFGSYSSLYKLSETIAKNDIWFSSIGLRLILRSVLLSDSNRGTGQYSGGRSADFRRATHSRAGDQFWPFIPPPGRQIHQDRRNLEAGGCFCTLRTDVPLSYRVWIANLRGK